MYGVTIVCFCGGDFMDKQAIKQIRRGHRSSAALTEELLSELDLFNNPIDKLGIDLSALELISPHSGSSGTSQYCADT